MLQVTKKYQQQLFVNHLLQVINIRIDLRRRCAFNDHRRFAQRNLLPAIGSNHVNNQGHVNIQQAYFVFSRLGTGYINGQFICTADIQVKQRL